MGNFITIYLVTLNVLTFIIWGVDKYKAIYNRWRISEFALFTLVILGGSLGAFIGMKVFQHKKSVARFRYGLPIIFILQLALFIYVYVEYYNRVLPF